MLCNPGNGLIAPRGIFAVIASLADPLIHLWCATEAGYKLHAMPGWYRAVKIELVEERADGLLLKYTDPLSQGTIETVRLEDGFVFGKARGQGLGVRD